MLKALSATGGVITSAGLVLAATFAVLTTLPLVMLIEVGFLVAFGVLLDALLGAVGPGARPHPAGRQADVVAEPAVPTGGAAGRSTVACGR